VLYLCDLRGSADKDVYWLDKLLETGTDVNVTAHPNKFTYETALRLALDWDLSIARRIGAAGAPVNGDVDPDFPTSSPLTYVVEPKYS
jgi:hypothetical protein